MILMKNLLLKVLVQLIKKNYEYNWILQNLKKNMMYIVMIKLKHFNF